MSEEKMEGSGPPRKQVSRRKFLATAAGAAIGLGLGKAYQSYQAERRANPRRKDAEVRVSPPEQVNKLTHYGSGVRDALSQNRERIAFNPETGALRVTNHGKVIYEHKAKVPLPKSISVEVGEKKLPTHVYLHVSTTRRGYRDRKYLRCRPFS